MQGSFSEPVVGFTSEDFNKLGQNLGRLYFGGEATSEEWYGYMQGAYLTGEEKGKLIAYQILPSNSECKARGFYYFLSCSPFVNVALYFN